jgi:hypothetical protein
LRTYLGELVLVAGYEVEVGGDGGGCHAGQLRREFVIREVELRLRFSDGLVWLVVPSVHKYGGEFENRRDDCCTVRLNGSRTLSVGDCECIWYAQSSAAFRD